MRKMGSYFMQRQKENLKPLNGDSNAASIFTTDQRHSSFTRARIKDSGWKKQLFRKAKMSNADVEALTFIALLAAAIFFATL